MTDKPMIDSEAVTAGAIRQSVEAGDRCPRCGVRWELGRDVGGVVHTPNGIDCLRRQLAQAQERERAALVREAWLRRVVDAAERLMIALDIAIDAEDADDTFVAALDDIAAQEIIELRAALSSAPADALAIHDSKGGGGE